MYIAEGLHFGETSPDEDEFLEIVKIPLDELCEMIVRGDVPDAKTQAAVLKTAYILNKRGDKK
jgi:ADP-ribose pyrophosphatase